MGDQEDSRFTGGQREAIAEAIKSHLHAHGISRKELIRDGSGKEKGPRLSLSTINKALAGDFSDATLTKIETVLGTKFHAAPIQGGNAQEDLGGYSARSVQEIEGSYVCVRPLFVNPRVLTAYRIDMRWDDKESCLVFSEQARADAKYIQSGRVLIPLGKPFLTLLTTYQGSVRIITVSRPEDGLCRGMIATLHNPRGAMFVPASGPVILKRLKDGEEPLLGYLEASETDYSRYKQLLDSVVAEDYCHFVTGVDAADRRRNISLVSP